MAFKCEINHHEGYCSGAENEYQEWVEPLPIGCVEPAEIEKVRSQIEEDFNAKVESEMGSGYCENDAGAHGLGAHECRVTFVEGNHPTKSANKRS